MTGNLKHKPLLTKYSKNVYSQFGEDGVIEKIFQIVGTSTKLCIEFGAWDGFHLSNTANLWSKKSWHGVLIEQNEQKYKDLLKATRSYSCVAINASVGYRGNDRLSQILKRNKIKEKIDFLSIDVDGNDYYIFADSTALHPRVICCEYNPTVPKELEIVANPDSYFGCSALALCNLAEKKGYKLVAITDTNCFFVRDTDFIKFHKYETELNSLFPGKHIIHLMTDYGGNYVFDKPLPYGFKDEFIRGFCKGVGYLPKASKPTIYTTIEDTAAKILPKPVILRISKLKRLTFNKDR